MAIGKKKVIVYTDWINQFKDLTDEEAGKLIKHFFEYVNDLNPISDRLTELLFNPIKATLKRDLQSWENKQQTNKENGSKGGRPKKNIETEINPNNPVGLLETQNNPQKGVSVNVSVNDNVNNNNIDSRKLKFADSLKPFLNTYGKETLNDFYGYWTEKGENDKKMRFEKQTSFDIKRRLTTWTKNDFNKKKEVTPDNLTPDVLYIMKQTGLTYEQLKG